MQKNTRWISGIMAALFMAGIALVPMSAKASEEGRRNTTLGLGALTGYLFTRGGSKVPAFIGLGATAYAYKRYDDSIKARHKRERYYYGKKRYRAGYKSGYRYAAKHRR